MGGEWDPEQTERNRRVACVAVAPFAPTPISTDEARVAQGFLEDVIAELARSPDMEVLAPRTSLNLSPEQLAPRRLLEDYGVTHILDTIVRPRASALHVKVNLVETEGGRIVWAEGYDAPRRDAGAMLDDIAAQVANHLTARVRLSRRAQVRDRPLTSLAAQDCWLRGLGRGDDLTLIGARGRWRR
jgi:adenylate cyclase